jgi:hypothetical protein
MRQEVDSLISAIGGLLFAEISSLWLAPSLGWLVRIVGAVGFVAGALVCGPAETAVDATAPPPVAARDPHYVICVALELVAIPLGALLFIQVLRQPAVVLPWVVILAGLHSSVRQCLRHSAVRPARRVLFGLGILGGALVLRWSPAYSALDRCRGRPGAAGICGGHRAGTGLAGPYRQPARRAVGRACPKIASGRRVGSTETSSCGESRTTIPTPSR